MDKPPAVYANGGPVAIRATDTDFEVYVRQGRVLRRIFWGARGRLNILDLVGVARLLTTTAIDRPRRLP